MFGNLGFSWLLAHLNYVVELVEACKIMIFNKRNALLHRHDQYQLNLNSIATLKYNVLLLSHK